MEEDQNQRLLEKIERISGLEMNEIELMMSIFQRRILTITEDHLDELNNEIDFSYENPDEKIEVRNEIINGYKTQFERIQNGLEEQYVNLFYELKEIQSNQKIALINYKKMLDQEIITDQDIDVMTSLIDRYGNYCGLEEECYKMINECSNSFISLLDSVMQYDKKEIAINKKIGIFEKIKSLLKKKKKEDQFLISKREKIKKITKDTDTIMQYIKNTTIKYISTLSIYKDIIKSEANEVV